MQPTPTFKAVPRRLGLFRTAAVCASLAAAAACVPFPAMAQVGGAARVGAAERRVEAPPTVELIQLTGKWETPVGPIVILGGGPGRPNNRSMVTGHVTNAQGQEISFGIAVWNGKLTGQGFETNWDGLRPFDATVLADGTLEFRFTGDTYQGRKTLAGFRTGAPLHAASPFVGRWNTTLGELELRAEGDHLTGTLIPPPGSRNERRVVALHGFEYGRPISGLNGAWRSANGSAGAMRIDLSSDGKRFLGSYSTLDGGVEAERAWSGQRVETGGAPPANEPGPSTPPGPGPGPAPGPGPGPAQPPPGEVPNPGFKPLNRLDVRVDRVQVARGYPTHQVHAFLTVKNTSASPQYFTSGFMKVVLADADGAGQERSQPYRASEEPAALFPATPVIQPGGELRVRYVFTPAQGDVMVSLTASEGGKQAVFPVQVAP
jgi:hypothetical protein